MRALAKIARFAAIAVALLFTAVSLGGAFGVWWANGKATDVALRLFGLVEVGVGVVDAGVGRVEDLIANSRTEVRQAGETITSVGDETLANIPLLNALNERLETRLAPCLAQMQQALRPVRGVAGKVSGVVEVLGSLPGMKERAPRLAALDESLNQLEELAADQRQLRSTLRALVAGQGGSVRAETQAALKSLIQRIDTRLGEVEEKVQSVQTEFDALKVRLEKRKSRLLFLFNASAFLATLLLLWFAYTQLVVIDHHWKRMRPAGL